MTEDERRSTIVLVTGGTGYLARWVTLQLLERGHAVRATVRDLGRADEVRASLAARTSATDRLSFTEADLLVDAGWEQAMEGVSFVQHVASPLPVGEFRGKDVEAIARGGMQRVLRAADAAGVRRTVVTSSTEAVRTVDPAAVADESVWTDLPDLPPNAYARSKTLAERDAWAFVADGRSRMELVTLLPSSIQGPVLSHDYSGSVDLVRMMLAGRMPALPNFGFPFVDVRDLADLHVEAMTSEGAAGERVIASGEFLWFREVAQLLRDELGDEARRVSTRRLPDVVVRVGARFNPELAQMKPGLGRRARLSSAKAEALFGWRTRPARESILDAARSLIERGLARR